MIAELHTLYSRDLDRLKAEIEAFQVERNIWKTKAGIQNSAGNLCLHLIGNLRTYIGKNIGNDNYVRDREAEFTLKDIPSHLLVSQIEATKEIVSASLSRLSAEELEEPYKEDVLGYPMSTSFFLLHLLAHLSYHLGQVNYLRRILEEEL